MMTLPTAAGAAGAPLGASGGPGGGDDDIAGFLWVYTDASRAGAGGAPQSLLLVCVCARASVRPVFVCCCCCCGGGGGGGAGACVRARPTVAAAGRRGVRARVSDCRCGGAQDAAAAAGGVAGAVALHFRAAAGSRELVWGDEGGMHLSMGGGAARPRALRLRDLRRVRLVPRDDAVTMRGGARPFAFELSLAGGATLVLQARAPCFAPVYSATCGPPGGGGGGGACAPPPPPPLRARDARGLHRRMRLGRGPRVRLISNARARWRRRPRAQSCCDGWRCCASLWAAVRAHGDMHSRMLSCGWRSGRRCARMAVCIREYAPHGDVRVPHRGAPLRLTQLCVQAGAARGTRYSTRSRKGTGVPRACARRCWRWCVLRAHPTAAADTRMHSPIAAADTRMHSPVAAAAADTRMHVSNGRPIREMRVRICRRRTRRGTRR